MTKTIQPINTHTIMAVLSWGKCDIKHKGGTHTDFTSIDTPKSDTTKLTSTAGQETTATEEGGAIVDYRRGKTTYQLEFDLFVKKGGNAPFVTDDDGVIEGEHAFQIIPEDTACEGIQIDRSVLSVEKNYSPAALHHLVARLLGGMEMGDFFALTTFLTEVNLSQETKVETSEATAPGQ